MDKNDHTPAILKTLDNDRKNAQNYCDITVSVQNVLFRAHRIVLETYSGYFKTLFQSNFMDNVKEVVELNGPLDAELSHHSVKIVFDFMYTLQANLTRENVQCIILASEYLLVQKLKTKCIEFMGTNICEDNWLSTFRIGMKLSEENLVMMCLSEFENIALMLCLNHDISFHEILHILEYQRGKMASWEIFIAIRLWSDFKEEQSGVFDSSKFEELIRYVDFEDIDQEGMHAVMIDPRVLNSNVILRRIATATAAKLASTETALQRIYPSNEAEIIIAGGDKDGGLTMEAYCVSCKQFRRGDTPMCPVRKAAVVSDGRYMATLGGRFNEGDVGVYYHNDEEWEDPLDSVLATPRSSAAAAMINFRVYLVGGLTADTLQPLADIEVLKVSAYSTHRDFETIPNPFPCGQVSLMQARANHVVVAYRRVIYVLGGSAYDVPLDSVEAVDVETGSRSDLPPMPVARSDFAAIVHDDSIIIMGGKCIDGGCLSTVDKYSFETEQWTAMRSMTTARYGHSACLVNQHQIFVIGGAETDNNSIEKYDCHTKKWSFEQTLKHQRAWASVMVVRQDYCIRGDAEEENPPLNHEQLLAMANPDYW